MIGVFSPFRWFVQYRHAADDPSENPNLNEYNRDGNNHLHPGRNVANGCIPAESDNGHIESVQNNPHDGDHGSRLSTRLDVREA